jgi:hypothetical protein
MVEVQNFLKRPVEVKGDAGYLLVQLLRGVA